MSAAIQTIQTFEAFFKPIFADQIANLIPEHEVLLKKIPFVSSEKQSGGDYTQPVILSRDHGVTYHGKKDNQLKLEAPINAVIDVASIRSSAMSMRTMISLATVSRSINSKGAFIDATSHTVQSLTESFAAIIEQTHWYGGSGLVDLGTFNDSTAYLAGNVVTAAAHTNSYGGAAGFTVTKELQLPLGSWAPAVWVGAKGMSLDVYSSAGAKKATVSVESVDINTRRIVFSASWSAATGDVLYRKGAYGLESLGVKYILQNTGSLFGIDASINDLWKANQYAAGGLLSFEKVAEAVSQAYGRGLIGKATLYVNSRVFATLFPDFNTLKSTGSDFNSRVFPNAQDVKRLEHGTNAIKFFINSVEIEVIATDYVQVGFGYLLAEDTWLRVGSTQMTFKTPGLEGSEMFRLMEEYSAIQLRAFADESMFIIKPARNLIISGITLS